MNESVTDLLPQRVLGILIAAVASLFEFGNPGVLFFELPMIAGLFLDEAGQGAGGD